MNTETLFNLGFEHCQAILLAFIPAIVTVILILHIYSNFPDYNINKVYLLFLFSILAWQINDCVCRMSLSEETARLWDRLLAIGWMTLVPSGVQWTLLLTGKKKLSNNFWFIGALYLSTIFFAILLCSGAYTQPFIYSPFWGWVRTYNNVNSFITVPVTWFSASFIFVLFLLGIFAYRNRYSPELKHVSILIFAGYSIPATGGIIVQIVFPLFLKTDPIPLTSTLMLTTVLVIAGLNAYKIFNLSETLNAERVTEMLQEIIFVVTPQRTITYINSYGASAMKTTRKGRKVAEDIFPHSQIAYEAFEQTVLIPSFKKMNAGIYHFSMEDRDGKDVHWDIMTYPLLNKSRLHGLLVVCRDVSDRVLIAEAKLSALRSRMNHHFIFNSLNTIQHYIHSYQREAAEIFLVTFSTFIRMTLNNSSRSFISLSEELKIIELYLDLEKARFGERLSFEINVDADLDMENTLLPSMLIQPYVENAIVHGLAPRQEGGKIMIEFRQAGDASIRCTIQDNGGGRQKAGELKSGEFIKDKSYGMNTPQARLEILNQYLPVPVTVNITDLFNKRNEPSGTQIEILIPVDERF